MNNKQLQLSNKSLSKASKASKMDLSSSMLMFDTKLLQNKNVQMLLETESQILQSLSVTLMSNPKFVSMSPEQQQDIVVAKYNNVLKKVLEQITDKQRLITN